MRRIGAFLVLMLLLVVGLCWGLIAARGAFPGDAESAAKVREEHFSWIALALAHALDWLARPGPAVLIVAALATWAWQRIGWRHAVLIIAALGAAGITWVLKDLVDRPRPGGVGLIGSSFPSGHTALAVSVLGLLTVFALQSRRWAAAAVSLAVAGAMGPSRVLLGVHWASDVLAGYAIGLAWLIAVLLIGMPWARRDRREARSYSSMRDRSAAC